MNNPLSYLFKILIFITFLVIDLQSQTIEQKLVVVQNDQTIGGIFSVQVEVKGTSLPAANTLGSATIDIDFNNSHLTFTSASNWAFGSSQGYNRSATNNTTSIRIAVTGGGVNQDGGGIPAGFDIASTYTSWVQLDFNIQSLTSTSLTIRNVTNAIGLFENHSNEPNTGVINNQSLTTPENINDAPLPVELSSFTASAKQNVVNLKWETATEVNNYGFDIERSKDEKLFEKVGFVKGHGNSNTPKSYAYSDKTNIFSSKIFYRLKQIDLDGTYSYSNVINVSLQNPESYELFQNFPNPFNPVTRISFQLPTRSNVAIKVFNIIGEQVAELLNEVKDPGFYEVNFDGSNLPSGLYIYTLNADGLNFIKKMMLVK